MLQGALPNLTALALPCWPGRNDIQGSVGALQRLRRLTVCTDWFFSGDIGCKGSIPQGPWLASIRWLGLRWGILKSGAAVLASACRLEYLHTGTGAAWARQTLLARKAGPFGILWQHTRHCAAWVLRELAVLTSWGPYWARCLP